MNVQPKKTEDIHPNVIVSDGGRGVSDELKAAGASPCPAVGTSERDALLSSPSEGQEETPTVVKPPENTIIKDNSSDDMDDNSSVNMDDNDDDDDDDDDDSDVEIQNHLEKYKSEEIQIDLVEKEKELEEKMKMREKQLALKTIKKSGKRFQRKQTVLDAEEKKCAEWFQESNTYEPPTPKYLLLRDTGVPKYTAANMMKRTSWLGMALGISARDKIPDMRRVNIKGVEHISICVEDPQLSRKLLDICKLGPCSVRITKDPRKNCSYGVLYDRDEELADMSEAAITELMSHHGVVNVMQFRKGKEQAPTKSYKITFDRLICPLKVTTIGGRYYEIKEYVPPPLRCFNCQRYNHAVSKCRYPTPTCQRCSDKGHQSRMFDSEGKLISQCKKPKKCFHCAGNHEAGDKECRIQMGEKKINEMIVLKKLTRYEARMQVLPQDGTSRRSAVEVVIAQDQAKERDKQVVDTITPKVDAWGVKTQACSEAVDKLTEKVEQLLNASKPMATPDPKETGLEKRLKEEFRAKFESLEEIITKQGEDIKQLQQDNVELLKSNENLKKKLIAEKRAKEKVMKELQELKKTKSINKRVLSDLSPEDSKEKKSDSNHNSSKSRRKGVGGGGTSSAQGRGSHQVSHSQPVTRPSRAGSGDMDVDHRNSSK